MPLVLLVPLVAAVLVLLGAPARRMSLAAAALNLVARAAPVRDLRPAVHASRMFDVIPSLDLKFLVGLDGLSLMMVAADHVVTLSAVWVTPKIEHGENAFYACLLFISAGAHRGVHLVRPVLLLRVPRTGAHPDVPAHRHLGARRKPRRRRVENHDLPRGGQLHSAARPDRACTPACRRCTARSISTQIARRCQPDRPSTRNAGFSRWCSSVSAR